jgi:hypothetical protein
MKFTIDTENKIIYFKESFTKEDIEYIFSILKIEGIDSWKIDMEQPYLNWGIGIPNLTQPIIQPYTFDSPTYYGTTSIVSSSTGSCTEYTATNTMSFELSEN